MQRYFTTGWRGLIAALSVGTALAGSADAKECWLDAYDKPNYEGSKVRIPGPGELPDLKQLNGADWSSRIESLQVGPDAEVVVFRKPNFEATVQGPINHPEAFKSWGKGEIAAYQEWELSLGPGQKEHHLGELNFHRNINSLKIRCR
jgi:hypothetical protein